jgi:hypothetical protein
MKAEGFHGMELMTLCCDCRSEKHTAGHERMSL